MSNKKSENKAKERLAVPPELGPEYFPMHQAAKMTGYHQDYLGQLARGGKLEAVKVGRNWFTTKLAIDKMLGRVQEPVQPSPEPVRVQEQVQETVVGKIDPPAKAEPVVAVTTETVKEEVKIARKEVLKPRIPVRRMIVSLDAGPNLQEMLASVAFRREQQKKIIGAENRDVLYRWKKISGQDSSHATRLVVDKLKREINALNNELVEIKRTVSLKRVSAEYAVQKKSRVLMPLAAGFAAIMMIVSATFFLTDYFAEQNSQVAEDNNINKNLINKMVAGESTSVDQNEMHWPPPYLSIRE